MSSEDVEALQLRRPHVDSPESSDIRTMILNGHVFSSFTQGEREAIVERIINMDVFIPSLYSFFEDFKLLECWSNCIKRLCPPVQDSIQLTLRYMFNASKTQDQYSKNGRNPFPIELRHDDIAYANLNTCDSFDIGYRQLWLFSVRNYHRMPPEPIKKGRLLATPNRGEADYHTVYHMAKLAEKLGFRSNQIVDILNDPPDRKIAYNMLLKARDPSAFRYNPAKIERFVDVIVRCFNSAKAIAPTSSTAEIPGPVHRCGIQQIDTHIGSTNMLYLTQIFDPTTRMTKGALEIEHVYRWVLKCFFGPCDVLADVEIFRRTTRNLKRKHSAEKLKQERHSKKNAPSSSELQMPRSTEKQKPRQNID